MKVRYLLLVALLVLSLAVAACGDDGNETTTPPATTVPTEPAPTDGADGDTDAATLFADNCSSCHGDDGSGGVGPDLRAEDNVEGIAEQIRQGGGGMPAFEGQLTDEQIQAIADYVVTL
jgi:mono/diheme cytochrome c family protein